MHRLIHLRQSCTTARVPVFVPRLCASCIHTSVFAAARGPGVRRAQPHSEQSHTNSANTNAATRPNKKRHVGAAMAEADWETMQAAAAESQSPSHSDANSSADNFPSPAASNTDSSLSTPPASISVNSRMPLPWHSHGGQISWQFARFAHDDDVQGLFDHIEAKAREKLREMEEEEAKEWENKAADAIAKGEQPPVNENTLPPHELSRKARRRVSHRLTSDSPSLAILKSVPRKSYVDAFQSFASLGLVESMEYIIRRMEQIGLEFDEELSVRWMEGICIAASVQRQHAVEALIEDRIAAENEAFSRPHGDNNANTSSSSSSTSASAASNSSTSLQSNAQQNSQLLDPRTLSIGLPCTGLVRQQMEPLLAHLTRAGLLPSFRLVRAAFEGLAIDNDVHGGLGFLTRLYKLRYYVSGFTYALFIQALAKHQNSQGCMFVFLHMEKAKFAPHAHTFNALIAAFAQVGDYRTAYKIMQDMQQTNMKPDTKTFAAIIQACCKAGKMDLALEMFEYLKRNQKQLTTTKQVYLAPKQDAASTAQQQQLQNYAEQDQQASDNAAQVLPEGKVNKNIKLLDQRPQTATKTVPLTLGPYPYGVLITEYIQRKQLKEAVGVLNSMIESDVVPLLKSYNQLLQACTYENRKGEARQIWSQMLSMGVVPQVFTYNHYMSNLDSLSQVKHVYEEMTKGFKAHLAAASSESSNEPQSAANADVVSSSGSFHAPLKPDIRTFKVLTRYIMSESDIDSVTWLLNEMRLKQVLPDVGLIRNLSRVLAQKGKEEQGRLLEMSFRTRGVEGLTQAFVQRLLNSEPGELQADWMAIRDIASKNTSSRQ